MQVEKFIKLTVDYDNIDISPNWVAFSISRTVEQTYTYSGIIDRETWNRYCSDPFSPIDNKKIIKHNLVLIHPEILESQPTCQSVFLDEDNENLLGSSYDFNYAIYQKNPHFSLYKKDYIAQKNSGKDNEFHYLINLDNQIAYFEFKISIPYRFTGETQENKIVFSTLHSLLQDDNFDMIAIHKNIHTNKKEYLEGFLNAIDAIDDPYVGDENDFCAPSPEFMYEIGFLKFKIPGFKDFDEFFTITKKYVPLDSMGISEKSFSLVMNLAILKTFYSDNVPEEFFQKFGEDYKMAQCIAMEYKLKPKNMNPRKIKI